MKSITRLVTLHLAVILCSSFKVSHQFGSNLIEIQNDFPSKVFKKLFTTTLSGLLMFAVPNVILHSSTAFANNYPMLQSAETQVIDLFQNVAPSVVYINTFVERLDAFSMNVFEVPQGTGSGFVWDNEGHIVTNYHVIRNSGSAKIIFTKSNGKSVSFKAEVTGVDPDKDVAVLKVDIDGTNLKPVQLGDSSVLLVGQAALAIGNPFGLDHTLTTGIVSGLGREMRSPNSIRPLTNLIQTDAAINPGNSGGPLLDSSGKLIGMNTAIYTTSGGSAGIGFAIPVNTLKYEVDALIRDGKVTRPALGIKYLESAQAKNLGIVRGILVLDAPVGSPAESAGLRSTLRNQKTGTIILGDIIIGMNDDAISSESDLFKAIEKRKVGEVVTLKVVRRANWKDEDADNGITSRSRGDTAVTTSTQETVSPFIEDEEDSSLTTTGSRSSSSKRGNGKSPLPAVVKDFVLVELKVKLGASIDSN